MLENNIITTPSVMDVLQDWKLGEAIVVHSGQPISIHRAVEKMATYFRNEFHYDFVPYTAEKDRISTRCDAYIWTVPDWSDIGAIGAACFRIMDDVGQPGGWGLDWIWFHPNFRRRGFLSKTYPEFVKKYGKFYCEPPVSPAMESFLRKQKHHG